MRKFVSIVLVFMLLLSASPAAFADSAQKSREQELFESYIDGIYGSSYYMHFEKLGEIKGYSYICGAASEITDSMCNAKIGEYLFTKMWVASPDSLGLFLLNEEQIYPLKTAYSLGVISDEDMEAIAAMTNSGNSRVSAHKLEDNEKRVYDFCSDLGLCGSGYYGYSEVGELGGKLLVTFQTNDYDYSEQIGGYVVSPNVQSFFPESYYNSGTQIFALDDSSVMKLSQACEQEILDIEEVARLFAEKNVYSVQIIPADSNPAENPTTLPTEAPTEAPSETLTEASTDAPTETPTEAPTQAPSEKYQELKNAVKKVFKNAKDSDIIVECYEKISGDLYLVRYTVYNMAYTCEMRIYRVNKYVYETANPECMIYDKSKGTLKTISDAYYGGFLSEAQLKKIASIFKTKLKLSYIFNVSETTELEAGQSVGYLLYKSGKTSFKSSNPKVVSIDNSGKVTALREGEATITSTLKNGATCSRKICVVSNPKLIKNGKRITSVSVKKGKTVKIRISGKAKLIDNKYTNTDFARITSKKSADTITVKGLRKGTTILKVKVNGVKTLKLKVRVK